MSFESVISHMNDHHKENLIDLCMKYDGASEVKSVQLVDVSYEGLEIEYDGKRCKIPFAKRADEHTLKDIIIELCQKAKKAPDLASVTEEMQAFMKSFGSVCLASLSPKGEVIASYAPLIQTQWGNFIYISEISEHFASITTNPKNLEVLFLEDESAASSVILRKRLRFRSEAKLIERGELFDKVYDEFEKQHQAPAIKTIRKMADFHLIELEFHQGRFVKGFGQAYDIVDGKATLHVGGNPHKRMHHHTKS